VPLGLGARKVHQPARVGNQARRRRGNVLVDFKHLLHGRWDQELGVGVLVGDKEHAPVENHADGSRAALHRLLGVFHLE